ncbi:MAG: hypothetical protein U1A72_04530 [Sulfuritalea sp.]|nr:hypothetical protein [Sulfuritalea sp.]
MGCSATRLAVDDNPGNLMPLCELLRAEYQVLAATSGPRALALAGNRPRPDLNAGNLSSSRR